MRSYLSLALLGFVGLACVSAQVAEWGQCGGIGYTGSTTCTSSNTCQYSNPWYSQCLPGGSSGSESTTRNTEWHYGGAFGVGNDGNSGFNVYTDCNDIELIRPDFLMNWGPNNRRDDGISVCNDNTVHFLPTLWGQSWDDSELSAIPDCPAPWGIILENEPNWSSSGPNWTAQYTASKYFGHLAIINSKWGSNNVKLLSPSPVNPTYPECGPGVTQGCAFQQQIPWLQQYFESCGCENEIWAINHHEYSCDMTTTKQNIQNVWNAFGNKNIFVGEIGCGGSPASQAQYLQEFASWAYTQPNLVGFFWIGVNNVGGPGNTPVANGMMTDGYGHVTVVGQTFQNIQAQYPPVYL